MKHLLMATALAEAATGLVFLALPSLAGSILLGASLDSPAALAMARLGGAAVLSIGVASWLVRNDSQGRAARGLLAALLLYNVAVAAVLVYAATGLSLSGIGLWPAVAFHAALTVWCIACLRISEAAT